jgi:hypothetical protein
MNEIPELENDSSTHLNISEDQLSEQNLEN